MSPSGKQRGRRPGRRALLVTLVYAALAAVWIYSSDSLLGLIVSDPRRVATLSTYKGWAFVAVTSLLLYGLLRNAGAAGRSEEEAASGEVSPPAAPSSSEAGLVAWFPLAVFGVLALLIAATGAIVFGDVAESLRVEARNDLTAIADLRVRQISGWLSERRGNAQGVSRDPFLAPEVESWLSRGAPEDETARRLRSRLGGLRDVYGFAEVSLVDTRGDVRLDVARRHPYSSRSRRLAREALESKKVVFVDLHRGGEHGESDIELGFFAPLLVETGGEPRAVGVVVLQLSPEQYLYPLIRSWPGQTASGETLLVRREGDDAVYLNELRHRQQKALTLRVPLARTDVLATKAVLGAEGPVQGVDYRGVPVLGCVRRVPGSPWELIAKMDLREVNAPVREKGLLAALIGGVLLLVAGLTVLLWWRQQRAAALVRKYRRERERQALVKHFDYLTRYANDVILLMDEEGRILEANDRAVSTYGYSREELLGSNVRRLRTPEALAGFEEQWLEARTAGGIVFETAHQRRDGSTLPVEVSTRAIDIDGKRFRQSIVRDVSERKEAERKIVRLSNLYAALSQLNQAILRGGGRDRLFQDLCRISVDCGLFKLAWVGLVEEETRRVLVAARYGEDGGYLNEIEVSVDPSRPIGQGPIGTAIRERRSYVCNDFFADPSTVPWRDSAAQVGFGAIAAFPLKLGGQPIGALAVYAVKAGFFDDETRELLEEMTEDVSYALDGLAMEERRRAAEGALAESEEKYRLLFTNERDAIVLHDAESYRILDANEAFLNLYGYSREELLVLSVFDFSAEREATARSLARARERGVERIPERRHRKKDGSELWVEINGNSFVWRGRPVICAIIRDITERKSSEERMLLFSKVLEDSAEGIVVTDASTRILTVNKAFTEVTGYSAEEAIGGTPKMLRSGQHDDAFYRSMWHTIAEVGRWQGEIWNRRKSGEVYPEWLSITAVRDVSGSLTHYVGIFADITERKASADRIQFVATHDVLTGLPNRPLMNDLLHQALASAHRKSIRLGLLCLDLDRFKTINDSLGPHAGDTLLQLVAARLGQCVREGDIVARLGGDEFLVMLPELALGQDAALVAEKILQAIQRPIVVQDRELSVTASIGISLYPHDGDDIPTLIKNADAAMYHAKEVGRNNFQFFTPDMNARAFEALSVETSLRRAIERDELTLLYQPQIQTESGRIVGAEALLRWRHRDMGLVLPSTFIPIAEQHGVILPIGDWVLKTVCGQLRKWLDGGVPVVPVAANVSALQFRQAGLVDRLQGILADTGIDPRYLELELTESIIMRDAEKTISLLRELVGMGLSLSIDDFGTGYSSLSYLRRFPIHKLKIDQSFVHDIPEDSDAAAIAIAIIGMGKSLKLRVIAEGVETSEQLKFLGSHGCDEVQGFLVGMPMTADELASLLTSGKRLVAG